MTRSWQQVSRWNSSSSKIAVRLLCMPSRILNFVRIPRNSADTENLGTIVANCVRQRSGQWKHSLPVEAVQRGTRLLLR